MRESSYKLGLHAVDVKVPSDQRTHVCLADTRRTVKAEYQRLRRIFVCEVATNVGNHLFDGNILPIDVSA